MKRSFRLRIALLSALLAGCGLIGFSAISWKLIYDAKVSRLDADLANQLKRAVRLPDRNAPPERSGMRSLDRLADFPNRWQFYESTLARELGTAIALVVTEPSGQLLYRSDSWTADLDANSLFRLLPSPASLTTPPPLDRPPPPLATRYKTIGLWRIGAIRLPQAQVAIAVSLQSIDQEMVVIRNIFLIAIPAVLILVAGGAWTLAGRALRPIRQLTQTIQTVSAKGLDQRVSSGGVDAEFAELIQVFNQMLERLERSFKQASRFSADAAHELKTPLTILQGELDRTLQQAEAGSAAQQRLGSLLDEVHRLSEIVRKLLLLSLADAGQISLSKAEVDLSAILQEMVEDFDLLAPELKIQTQIADRLLVRGDRDLLIQVLQNLLSNAIKYNLPHGWIQIAARQQANQIAVTFTNASKPIAPDDRHRIFDRFWRGDAARTRTVEGTGLGLSLAREIAIAHGGDLTLNLSAPGQTAFTLHLPIAAIASTHS